MSPTLWVEIAMSRETRKNQMITSSNIDSARLGGKTQNHSNNDPFETEITKPNTKKENSNMTPILEMEIVPNERTSTQVALHVVPEQEGIPCPSGFVFVRQDEGVDVKNSTDLLLVHHSKPQSQMPVLKLPEILGAISDYLRGYVIFSNPAHPTLTALWLVHTWVVSSSDFTPYLHILSPEKQCGKSRLLECIGLLCRDPWPIISPTPSVLFRKIHEECPTVLIDEVDTIFSRSGDKGKEALRGVLNAGFQRHAKVARCSGGGRGVRDFRVFCPKALAGIGSLPDTIADRCIPIRLERKAKGEEVERFRVRDARAAVAPLVQSLENWSLNPAVIAALKSARPTIPDALGDRQADICEPLLAIAEMAAGEWPESARSAILSVCTKGAVQDDSLGVKLLSDIRRVFGDRTQLSTVDLLHGLIGLDTDAPWALWWPGVLQGNTPSAASKVAQMLHSYEIAPQTIRIGMKTIKGYRRERFEESWSRYCLPVRTETVTPSQS